MTSTDGSLSLSKDQKVLIDGLSYILSGPQLRTYSVMLSQTDFRLMLHQTQADIAQQAGLSVTDVRSHIADFTKLGLIKKWRGPSSRNYYQFSSALPEPVIASIAEKSPEYAALIKETVRRQRVKKFRGNRMQGLQSHESASEPFVRCTLKKVPAMEAGSEEDGDPLDCSWLSDTPLDPGIRETLHLLTRKPVSKDQPIIRLLAHLGFWENADIDVEGLTSWLIDQGFNDIQRFGELLQSFREDSSSVAGTDLLINYKAFFDGACSGNPGPMAIKFIVYNAQGHSIEKFYKELGHGTNNVAEYLSLLALMSHQEEHNIEQAQIHGDSQLVINQVLEKWQINESHLEELAVYAWELMKRHPGWRLSWIPRELNVADGIGSAQ